MSPFVATLEDQTSSGRVEELIRSEISWRCSTLSGRCRFSVPALFKPKSANRSLVLSSGRLSLQKWALGHSNMQQSYHGRCWFITNGFIHSLDAVSRAFLCRRPRGTTSALGSVLRTCQFWRRRLTRLHPNASWNLVFTDEEEENEYHGQFSHHETHFQEEDCFPELTQTSGVSENWPELTDIREPVMVTHRMFLMGFYATNCHQCFDVIAAFLWLLKHFCDWMLL